MTHALTRSRLEAAVADAAADALGEAAVPTGKAMAGARRLAESVSADPRVAPALEPVSRLKSQTLRGVAIAAGAPLVVALGKALGAPIAESAAAELVSTLVSLAGAAYAWYGRETTTRPLK
ncbi:hypothetical protein [Chenggangzhangella methanolivorans]|uniref:Holin n=1 Tax=Chenggangzhangella methanolivorans TaxID=1437009 RepID=A0A9E6ULP2_9HYPH|nr:hypothetical protein [Chenggangzhangella methanolivorans]QZO00767.1 hypothetical protein K6K41_03545 [Chenggangzhangella methanolivorans]